MRRIKGMRDLVFDGVQTITNLVQRTHTEVSERWTKRAALVPPVAPVAETVNAVHLTTAALSYATVRLVSHGVGGVVKAVTEPLLDDGEGGLATPMSEEARGSLPWVIDYAETALNAYIGDHLAERDNGLDMGMSLRHQGRPIPLEREALRSTFPDAANKVCVFVHGLSATEWSWVIFADRVWSDPTTCYGTKLQQDLGVTPLFVRYNSGRPLEDSGRALSLLLTELSAAYPVPIEELTLLGHSMGGLVVRSAAQHGSSSDASWLDSLRHVFCIGAPHLGAPLEKGVELLTAVLRKIPAAGATVPAAVIDARSAGIKDLRDGCNAPLVEGVGYYAIAATIADDPDHPASRLLGDLLVRRGSATGGGGEHVAFDSQQVFAGMNHLQLANHPAVYEVIHTLMAGNDPDEIGPAMICFQDELDVSTKPRGLHDITRDVTRVVGQSGVRLGLCTVFVRHTSASLIIQENADPAVLRDLDRWIAKVAPEGEHWEHSDEGRDDMPAHARSAMTKTAETIPISNGKLALGTWQALYLWEHRTRSHQRNLVVHVSGVS